MASSPAATSTSNSDSDSDTSTHPLPPPPAQWDLDHLAQLEALSLSVTQTHLILALDHVTALLNAKGYSWAVMGGVGLFMHGYMNRHTRDVDLAVEGRLRGVIEALRDERIYTPPALSMAGSGCGRFHVLVGPEYGEQVEKAVVEVDLIMAGHLGAPETLAGATTTKTAQTAVGPRTYNVVSVGQLCRAKLHALDQREAGRDFSDLEWLCMNYAREIEEIADTLDGQERVNFVEKYRRSYLEKGEGVVKALMAMLKLG